MKKSKLVLTAIVLMNSPFAFAGYDIECRDLSEGSHLIFRASSLIEAPENAPNGWEPTVSHFSSDFSIDEVLDNSGNTFTLSELTPENRNSDWGLYDFKNRYVPLETIEKDEEEQTQPDGTIKVVIKEEKWKTFSHSVQINFKSANGSVIQINASDSKSCRVNSVTGKTSEWCSKLTDQMRGTLRATFTPADQFIVKRAQYTYGKSARPATSTRPATPAIPATSACVDYIVKDITPRMYGSVPSKNVVCEVTETDED